MLALILLKLMYIDVPNFIAIIWLCADVFFFSRVLYVGSCRLNDRHGLSLPSAQMTFENK